MSDVSQGPGWWLASDGKWYPPQQAAPTAPAAPAAPTAPQAPIAPQPAPAAPGDGAAPGAQPGYVPLTPAKTSNKGCMTVLIIFLVLGLLAGIAAVVGIAWLGNKVDSGEAFGKTTCDFVGEQEVGDAMGAKYDLIQLGGLTAIATPALDARVIPDGKTCWATPSGTGTGSVVRIARLETGDAAGRYQQELTNAKGTTQDKGNGLSVSTEGYLGKELSGVGDQAFCTTTDLTGSSGVLVRTGDKLVYVSVGLDGVSTPSIDLNAAQNGQVKFGSDDKNCEVAQKIAAKVR